MIYATFCYIFYWLCNSANGFAYIRLALCCLCKDYQKLHLSTTFYQRPAKTISSRFSCRIFAVVLKKTLLIRNNPQKLRNPQLIRKCRFFPPYLCNAKWTKIGQMSFEIALFLRYFCSVKSKRRFAPSLPPPRRAGELSSLRGAQTISAS